MATSKQQPGKDVRGRATAMSSRRARVAAGLVVLAVLLAGGAPCSGGGRGQGVAHRPHGCVLDVQQNSDVLVSEDDVTFTFVGPYTFGGPGHPHG